MFACVCHALPESLLQEAAAAGASAEAIATLTGAGSACGQCIPRVERIVTAERERRGDGRCAGEGCASPCQAAAADGTPRGSATA